MQMQIGVLGAHGYIGSHTVEKLSSLGYDIRGLDRSVFTDFNFQNCDTVINCAWVKLQNIQDLQHLDFARTTIELLENAKRQGVRIINLGSHAEYSIQDTPQNELDRCEPVTTYGLAKLMVTLHAKKLGFNTLRLFAVYGAGGRTFKDIVGLDNAKYSQPENVKDFVHVMQVVRAIERLLHMQHLYGEIINVCSGSQESAKEIVLQTIPEDETNREQKLLELYKRFFMYPMRQTEPSMNVGDPSKMIKLLNIKP